MADESFQERTQPATQRRRKQAREEGKVARSQEINSAFVLLSGLGLLALTGPFMLERLASIARKLLGGSSQIELGPGLLIGYFAGGIPHLLLILAPVALGIMGVGLLVNFAQVGFVPSWKSLAPKLDAISPTRGFSRLFSKQSGVELIKSLFKIALIALIAWLTLRSEIPRLTAMFGGPPLPVYGYAATVALKLGLRVVLAILFIAIFDYAFQRWEYEKSIRMSHKELQEELRQTEGDPHVKARVRTAQRELVRHRMMDEIKTANVVVTNPTRLAVALRYNRATMRAPKVVAKGARLLADRIRELAAQHDVPIVEDPPLARMLFKVEIDAEVPVALFRAIAELLAYIYRLKQRRAHWPQSVGAPL
ncbi:MAG: flagellar biosynthesis protein FlhB [Candidatus Eisenbacteria sp.]|nr:flagellar biosynthesis protein FlhB [Candidatus Eisenbacteria bacterium]